MENSELKELVEKANDPKTKKSDLVDIVVDLCDYIESLPVEEEETSVVVESQDTTNFDKAIDALKACAKKEMSILARRALKELV